MPVNFLTFDIEEWYRVNYDGIDPAALKCEQGWMERCTGTLLDICAEAKCTSTFFVLGSVARDYPELVRRIASAGHELASHSFAHKSVASMTPGEFNEDLRRSCGILESITGRRVRGYRAPSFSVTRETLPWFYDALEKAGLDYSSSVFPGKTFLYGIPDSPHGVHRPTKIVEFPVTRVDFFGKTLGLYVRLFPTWFIRRVVRAEHAAGRPGMLYVHPREIDPGQPRLPLRWPQSVIHYFGLRGCERKLRRLASTVPGSFVSIAEALDSGTV